MENKVWKKEDGLVKYSLGSLLFTNTLLSTFSNKVSTQEGVRRRWKGVVCNMLEVVFQTNQRKTRGHYSNPPWVHTGLTWFVRKRGTKKSFLVLLLYRTHRFRGLYVRSRW